MCSIRFLIYIILYFRIRATFFHNFCSCIIFIFQNLIPATQFPDRGGKCADLSLRSQNVPKLPEILGNRKNPVFSRVSAPFPAFPRIKKTFLKYEIVYNHPLYYFLGILGTLGTYTSKTLIFQRFEDFEICSQARFSWEQNRLFWEQNYIKS